MSSKESVIAIDWLVNSHALRVCVDVVERAELGIWLGRGCESSEAESGEEVEVWAQGVMG